MSQFDGTIGLSFDLSRKSTGIATWANDTPGATFTVKLPDIALGGQLADWEEHIASILDNYEPDWVAWEDARAVSKQHGMILFGMTGMLLAACWKRGITNLGINQMTAKKTLTGTGKATKADMMAAAKKKWPRLKITTDDEADALAVGLTFILRAGK